jgi:hypothetical protein
MSTSITPVIQKPIESFTQNFVDLIANKTDTYSK